MTRTVWGIAVGVALATAGVGLAGPASAEPLSGPYIGTMIEPGASGGEVGLIAHFLFTPCGQDCTRAQSEFGASDLHLQGNSWTEPNAGDPCLWTMDGASLVIANQCTGEPRVASPACQGRLTAYARRSHRTSAPRVWRSQTSRTTARSWMRRMPGGRRSSRRKNQRLAHGFEGCRTTGCMEPPAVWRSPPRVPRWGSALRVPVVDTSANV